MFFIWFTCQFIFFIWFLSQSIFWFNCHLMFKFKCKSIFLIRVFIVPNVTS
jgi:hypothetical protein